jgi:hypothetical protein
MKIADDLRDGALDAEEFVGEEIEDLERFILEQALGAARSSLITRSKLLRSAIGYLLRVRVIGC